MTSEANVSHEGATLTVKLPLQFRRTGGRKQVVLAEGQSASVLRQAWIDNTLVKAIARAHRWQRMLESGSYASIAELAVAERINPSYLARMVRLILLAPELVERIVGGQAPQVTLGSALKAFPSAWDRQFR
jgi:hypothetical protein